VVVHFKTHVVIAGKNIKRRVIEAVKSSQYIIEKAQTGDAVGLARVHVDTWRTTYQGIVPQAHLDSLSYEKRQSSWCSAILNPKPKYHLWVAKDSDSSVIGFSDGGVNRDKSFPFEGEIYAIYLLKEFQRQGIGKRLFLSSVNRWETS
jgi:ribosomal protein S18 acetylase RimI-like enzyme